MTSALVNNLCNSCTNIGCEFQYGIVRTKCAFYMPPHIEPDNCGNYVVMQPTVETIPKDQGMDEIDFIQPKKIVGKLISADVLDKIRAEIEQTANKQFQIAMGVADLNERYTHIQMENAYRHSLNIIDKHIAERSNEE